MTMYDLQHTVYTHVPRTACIHIHVHRKYYLVYINQLPILEETHSNSKLDTIMFRRTKN